MRRLGTVTRGLTQRGRCVLAAGAALAACSIALGQEDLLRAAVFLLLLPLVAIVVVLRTRHRLSCRRWLAPGRVRAGDACEAHLRVDNTSRLPSGVMLMEDTLPFALGGRPRFVLDRIEPGGRRDISYVAQSDLRGRFPVGPLTVRLSDPFGLCEMQRSFSEVDHLVVTPPIVPLPRIGLGGDRTGGGEASMSALSTGNNDVTTREYRQGDDLRRVHWRSTARLGELMVRQEETPRQDRATLLLDSRAAAHRGEGARSSFEWAVSALASIGVALSHQSFTIHLATGTPLRTVPPEVHLSEDLLLDALAEVELTAQTGLAPLVESVRHDHLEGMLIAVLGALNVADTALLAPLTASGSKIAFVLDPPSWGRGSPHSPAAVQGLRLSGWRVIEVPRGTLVGAAWSRADVTHSQHATARLVGQP